MRIEQIGTNIRRYSLAQRVSEEHIGILAYASGYFQGTYDTPFVARKLFDSSRNVPKVFGVWASSRWVCRRARMSGFLSATFVDSVGSLDKSNSSIDGPLAFLAVFGFL